MFNWHFSKLYISIILMGNTSVNEMSHYFIWTIGCQMNKAESLQIARLLFSYGYQAADSFENADLIILNTCVVRQSAENKVLGMLGLLKGLKRNRPLLSILITGCFVSPNIDRLKTQFPQVDLFFRPGDYSKPIHWLQEKGLSVVTKEANSPLSHSPCALVPIIQGCNNFCSYCIVPYRRGREVSYPMEKIFKEVHEAVQQGAREVTLLGQNVNSYGHDLPGEADLASLLIRLNNINGLQRIRLLTNHPKDMNLRLVETMASLPKVCEHIELPFQAGDDDILQTMRRGYTIAQYRDLVRSIRNMIHNVSLSTDIIVGFPGETERQFERTLSILEEVRFDVVHTAVYSPRPNTIAWRKYKDVVPPETKKRRFITIEKLQTEIASEINAQLQDRTVEILVEGKKRNKWYGRTRNNKLVFFQSDADQLGKMVKIEINATSPWALQGNLKYTII
jgi:tRNA-2-methylthio-N6-dimethylallyladenosine synthase